LDLLVNDMRETQKHRSTVMHHILFLLIAPALTAAFLQPNALKYPQTFAAPLQRVSDPSPLFLTPPGGSDLEDEIDYNAKKRAAQQGGGTGEFAAGAILGGLLGGPFGALFGAQIGAQFGAKNALQKARREEMERLGITEDMLMAAQEVGRVLQQAVEGLEASRNSLETQQRFARRLEQSMEKVYDRAKQELSSGHEEEARKLLMERQQLQDKLKSTLKSCADERRRYRQMENNIDSLQQRAMEIDSLLRRTVGAKSLRDSSSMMELDAQDPLLQKFRDLGID
jgi:DNA repair exonuclease SbcCD ATPase subunit